MQMVIEMPDELKGVGEAVRAMVRQVEATWRSTRGGRAVDYLRLSGNWRQARQRLSGPAIKRCCRGWMWTSRTS